MMNDRGKSDRSIVPEKPPNKADSHAAEAAEERGRAKGNPPKHDKRWTPSQASLPIGLERVRQLRILILLRALAADLRQEPNMGNLYVRIRAGGAERSASLPRLGAIPQSSMWSRGFSPRSGRPERGLKPRDYILDGTNRSSVPWPVV